MVNCQFLIFSFPSLVKTIKFSKPAVTQLIRNMTEYYCGKKFIYNNLVAVPKLRENQGDLRQ